MIFSLDQMEKVIEKADFRCLLCSRPATFKGIVVLGQPYKHMPEVKRTAIFGVCAVHPSGKETEDALRAKLIEKLGVKQ